MASSTQNANHPLEIPNHRVERVDDMTLSYILRAIQAYASTAEGRQGPLGDMPSMAARLIRADRQG